MVCPSTASGEVPGEDDTSARLRVLIVDDSEYYVEAASHLLATYPCVGEVRQALSSSQALAYITTDPPDLALVDIAMPEMNGLDLTRTVKALPHPPKVVVVTLYDTLAYREAARAVGADGFVGKSRLGEDLRAVIRQLFGETRRCKP